MTGAVSAAAQSSAVLKPDPFLSRLMERPSFALLADAVPDIDALPPAPAFVTAKVPAADVARAVALQDIGFRVVDMALTWQAAPVASAEDDRVRPARDGDREAVERVAGSAFRFSRFHLDPAVPDAVADRIKAVWAGNFFTGARGDAMLVAQVDGQVAGFLQLVFQAAGVVVIDLIAVAPWAARRGLARAMIAAAPGPDGCPPARLRVGTQAVNIASCRLYQSLGFRVADAVFVLHHHGRSAPSGRQRTRSQQAVG